MTLIQRFGGSLNLNVHFHILSIDGVFDEEGMFKDALAPSNDEIVSLVNKIKQR